TSLVVKRGMQPVQVSLKPEPLPPVIVELPQAVRLSSDITRGTVKLDDQTPGELKDGEFILDNLPWGKHTLEITSSPAKAIIHFEAIRGSVPAITDAPSAKELKAVIVSSFRNRARIQATYGPVKINVVDT